MGGSFIGPKRLARHQTAIYLHAVNHTYLQLPYMIHVHAFALRRREDGKTKLLFIAFLEKLLGEDLDEKDMVAGLKSFVEHYTANLGKQRHFLIVCDGNIGCGKTAFLDEIGNSQHLPSDVQIFREPVAKNVAHSWWSLMEKFYRDMKSGKGPAAVVELENAIWAHHRKIATQRESHVITERCCDSSLWVFCKALQKKGTLPEGPLVLTMRPDIPFFLCTV